MLQFSLFLIVDGFSEKGP